MEVFTRFPFDIEENKIHISQGFNGPRSHKSLRNGKLDLSYSLDFALPVNTTILAVKAGFVTHIKDDSEIYYDGVDPNEGIKYGNHCNFLCIQDLEKEYQTNKKIPKKQTHYIHLAKDSVKVKVGDIIKPGDEIGKTGMSGWIGDTPHLHLQHSVFKPLKGRITLPFCIKGYDGSLEHDDIVKKQLHI